MEKERKEKEEKEKNESFKVHEKSTIGCADGGKCIQRHYFLLNASSGK
jgi:hypothetical protein